MNNTITRKNILYRSVIILTAITAAVILPQLFHAIGALTGMGNKVGTALLPMHIPVILAGFVGGPVAGAIAGIISPLVSFAISGMPSAALMPFMLIELGIYGFTSGLVSGTKFNSFVQLIIVQLSGRAARALAILASVYLLGNTALSVAAIGEFIAAGLFGTILQWAVIPLAVNRIRGRNDV